MSGTVRDMTKAAREALEKAGIPGAAREAHILVAIATGIPRDRLSLSMQDAVEQAQWDALNGILPERLARKPLSHILGQRDFFKHNFKVSPQVLDPRPETEVLVELALAAPFASVLDLGTGSGAIVISLLAERPTGQAVATDLSPAALDVARENAERIGVADRCTFLLSDWFAAVDGRFDLIVSNPPYIAADEMKGLAPELAHEPRLALTDEGDGLSAYRAITAGAPAHLEPGGRLMVEIGPTQGAAVAEMFRAAGLENVAVHPDLDGRDRVVSGRMPQKRD
ncbi:peptide chain release factor N(5)-glutamine methyltransferase [Marimonas lutisalis]|uniref:peptide chain release factor N(5)-glutamine methyltransferase n=1 Tax=Marimonas lutisalis TaxID=2545756 RepID=UPI002E25A75F